MKKCFVCVCVQVVLPTLNDSKAEHNTSTVDEVRIGSTKETRNTFSDHELAVNDVIESFGGFCKYYHALSTVETYPQLEISFRV
jgi:hypothetical protein